MPEDAISWVVDESSPFKTSVSDLPDTVRCALRFMFENHGVVAVNVGYHDVDAFDPFFVSEVERTTGMSQENWTQHDLDQYDTLRCDLEDWVQTHAWETYSCCALQKAKVKIWVQVDTTA